MPAPLAKGLIVATTLLIAASLSLYENEQLREWIDLQRRKLADAFQYGPDARAPDAAANPQQLSDLEKAAEVESRRRREAVVRRNLYLHGVDGVRARSGTADKKTAGSHSFADFLDGEGRLRDGEGEEAKSTALEGDVVEATAEPMSEIQGESRASTPTMAARSMTEGSESVGFISPFASPPAEARARADPFAEWSGVVFEGGSDGGDRREEGSRSRTLSSGVLDEPERSECGSEADWVSTPGASTPGISTPGDWSEVGSVVSGEEVGMRL